MCNSKAPSLALLCLIEFIIIIASFSLFFILLKHTFKYFYFLKKMGGESVKKCTKIEFLSPCKCEHARILPPKLIRAVAWCVIPG